ncbi:hypothetical protein Mapa_010688 [Marchantia paleacea]|nr:hypothetical protein Mapa_010688 [Marchantia paleacea]
MSNPWLARRDACSLQHSAALARLRRPLGTGLRCLSSAAPQKLPSTDAAFDPLCTCRPCAPPVPPTTLHSCRRAFGKDIPFQRQIPRTLCSPYLPLISSRRHRCRPASEAQMPRSSPASMPAVRRAFLGRVTSCPCSDPTIADTAVAGETTPPLPPSDSLHARIRCVGPTPETRARITR